MDNSNNDDTQHTSPSNVSSDITKRKYTFVKLSKNNNNVNMSPGQGVRTTSEDASNIDTSDLSSLLPPPLPLINQVRKRFAKTSKENIYAIKEKRFEEKTVKSTTWGVKIFKEWLGENDLNNEFETMLPSELDKLLAQFYVELRKVDGTYYCKTSYVCIRAALQRHLQNPPWNATYCILKDTFFLHSNQVMQGVFKTLTLMGVSKVAHHTNIESGDMLKLVETGVIGTHNPRALSNLVWLSVALQFGKRGQEGYRAMTQDTFRRGRDDSGCHFYEYAACETQKNHSGRSLASTYKPQGRMYAQPDDPLCPVSAMDMYLSLLNPELPCLWQKPNDQKTDKNSPWFCKMPLGHNSLSNMMKRMSKDAGLSQIYTNHCTRATVSKALGDANFDRSDIIKITGHRDTRSLDTYIGGASSSKKRALSGTLSELTCHGKSLSNILSEQNKQREKNNINIDNDPPQNVTENSTEQVGNSPDHVLNLDDNEISVFEKNDNEDREYEINMIKNTQDVEYRDNKRPYIFNNCVFKNATFN